MKCLIVIFGLLSSVVAIDMDWSMVQPRHIDDQLKVAPKGYQAEGRITNGEVAAPKQFPYQVGLLLHFSNGRAWCGGTLISDRWIVTAAHCTDGATGVEVYLGATNRTDTTEKGQQIIYVGKRYIYVHEEWDERNLLNDISLLKLPMPIGLNDYIRPARLPKIGENSTYVDERVIASGWGRDSDAAAGASQIFRWIEVPVMENNVCNRYYMGSVRETHVCISTKGKKSTCNGDSGGPLVLADGSDTLIGATSFGVTLGCEVEFPAVFTRITSFLDWIRDKSGVVN